ncbi:unnamed protein product [Peniophora sp. CBMAI 1063]|nr:unnamed protein product [Peniophora sp. CBMAI 1063]
MTADILPGDRDATSSSLLVPSCWRTAQTKRVAAHTCGAGAIAEPMLEWYGKNAFEFAARSLWVGNCGLRLTCSWVTLQTNTGAIAWRLQLGSAFIPAVPSLAVSCLARSHLVGLSIAEEQKVIRAATFFARAMELFANPRVRRATVASGVVMLVQQMSGINIIALYSSSAFANAG